MKLRSLFCIILAAALCASAYTRSGVDVVNVTPLFRTDSKNIQWMVNSSLVAGAKNATGAVVITAGSNPFSAIQAGLSVWAAVPAAQIGMAPLINNSAVSNNGSDGKSVLTIQDNAINRSLLGGALGLTLTSYTNSGAIVDTDILFSPAPSDGAGGD